MTLLLKSMGLLRPVTFASLLLLGASITSTALAGQSRMPTWEPDLVPSGAIAGECYARVEIPAQYSTSTETVMVEEGYSKLEISQPQLANRQEQVLTKEASVRYEVRQPRYKTVSEQIMVRPSYNKLSVSAPQFRTVTETIQTSAPRLIWKRGNPGRLRAQGYRVHSTADDRARSARNTGSFTSQLPATHCGATCEIWCLVEEPGESISFNRKVMTSPGAVRRIPVAAKYTTVSKQVVAEPGSVREIPIAALYRSITVEDVVNPGGERMVNMPAVYGKVNKRTLVQGERYEWRRVVCRPGTARQSPKPKTNGTNGSATVSHISWAHARSVIASNQVASAYINDGGMMGNRNDPKRVNPEITMRLKDGRRFIATEPFSGAFSAEVENCKSCSFIAIAMN